MHKFILGLALFFTTVALAGTDPSNTFRLGDGNPALDKKVIFNQGTSPYPSLKWNSASGTLQFSNDGVTFSDLGSGSGSGQGFNVLVNPDFESGILQGWTHTGGTFSAVSAGSNLLLGKGSATFLSTTNGQSVTSSAYIIPNGLISRACSVGMLYKGGSSNLTLQAFDGTNVLATQVLQPVTTATPVTIPFQCPASGTIQLRLLSTGSSALIAMDQMFLGQSVINQVSQATLYGSISVVNPSCSGNFGVASPTFATLQNGVTGCTYTVTGNASAPSTVIPAIKFANLPPGNYVIDVTGNYYEPTSSKVATYAIFDGTNYSVEQPVLFSLSGGEINVGSLGTYSFSYPTAQTNITFEVQGKVDSGGAADLGSTPLTIKVYRFPSQTEAAVAPETINWLINASNTYNTSLTLPPGGPSDIQYTGSGANPLVNYGTLPAMQSCTSPTASTGTTCVAANNDVGIAFNLPAVQTVEACVTFNQIFNGIGAEQSVQFTVVETPDTALTVIQSAKYDPIIDFALGSGTANFYFPVEHCSIFPFTSAGLKHLRLFSTKSAGSAVIYVNPNVDNAIFNWRVKPLTQNVPAPILVGQPVAFRVDGVPNGNPTASPFPIVWPTLGTFGYDTNSAYNTSTGEYTIPVGGLWAVDCSLAMNQTAGTDYQYDVYILKTNGGVLLSFGQTFYDGAPTVSRSRIAKTFAHIMLNQGDKIVCEGSLNIPGTWAGDYTTLYFEGNLIRN